MPHIFLKDVNWLWVFDKQREGIPQIRSCDSDTEFSLCQVVHMVRVNHLHFEDYDHVQQHFFENSFWIYQECCLLDIHTWKYQWCSHWYHKHSESYLQNIRAPCGLEMESKLWFEQVSFVLEIFFQERKGNFFPIHACNKWNKGMQKNNIGWWESICTIFS